MTRVEQAALKYRQALHKENQTKNVIALLQESLADEVLRREAAWAEWKRIEREEAGDG